VPEFDRVTASGCTAFGARVGDASDPYFRRLRVLGSDGAAIVVDGAARGRMENVEVDRAGGVWLEVCGDARPSSGWPTGRRAG